MSAAISGAQTTTRRITLKVAGLTLSRWISVQICRNLRDIAGSFTIEYRDSGREALVFDPDLDPMPRFPVVLAGQACVLAIDGTVVLSGYIDEVDVNWEGEQLSCTIIGRDKTGDLVDCAAAANGSIQWGSGSATNGKVEWRNLSPLQLAQAIAQPYGITVRADVPIDATFPVFGVDADELAMSAIEKACRQAALLAVSDGVGGLLLTRGGSTRAPASLTRPGNILGGGRRSNWTRRFSDYFVKGQTNRSVIRQLQVPAFSVATDPRDGFTVPIETTINATTTESVAAVMTGHAADPEVTRYRPTVRMAKTQAGAATVQEQADWSLRIAKGMAETLNYRVLDWRAGASNGLWLPNALARVTDPFCGVDKDMLISGVTYRFDAQGEITQIELAGRTAFDRIDEPAENPLSIQSRRPKSFGPTRQG